MIICIIGTNLKKYRIMNQTNINEIQLKLFDCKWDLNNTNVDILYNEFIDTTTKIIDIIAPIRYKKFQNDKKWWDNEIKEKIKIRDQLYKKYEHGRTAEDWIVYKQKRNEAATLIKKNKPVLCK